MARRYNLNNKILFDEDLEKIEQAVVKYPMGSYQIGEIARVSALLYNEGIDVLDALCKFADAKEVDCNIPVTKTEEEMFAYLKKCFGFKKAVEKFDLCLRLARAGIKELDSEDDT